MKNSRTESKPMQNCWRCSANVHNSHLPYVSSTLLALILLGLASVCRADWQLGDTGTQTSINSQDSGQEPWGDWGYSSEVTGQATADQTGVSVSGTASSSASFLDVAGGGTHGLTSLANLEGWAQYYWDGAPGQQTSYQVHISIALSGQAMNGGLVQRNTPNLTGNASSVAVAAGTFRFETEGMGEIRGSAGLDGVANPEYTTVNTYGTIGDVTDHFVDWGKTIWWPEDPFYNEAYYGGLATFSIELEEDYLFQEPGEDFLLGIGLSADSVASAHGVVTSSDYAVVRHAYGSAQISGSAGLSPTFWSH